MTHILRGLMLCSALSVTTLTATLVAAPMAAFAHEGHVHAAAPVTLGEISISDAYTRATLPRAPVGGGFMTIVNGGEADRLLSVTAPVGDEVQIHEMAVVDGVMTMRALENGLEIPAGATMTLAPGGLHLMIMGLTAPLVEGEVLEMQLTFEKAGTVAVPFEIRAINAKAGESGCEHGAGHEGHAEHGHTQDGHAGHGDPQKVAH